MRTHHTTKTTTAFLPSQQMTNPAPSLEPSDTIFAFSQAIVFVNRHEHQPLQGHRQPMQHILVYRIQDKIPALIYFHRQQS